MTAFVPPQTVIAGVTYDMRLTGSRLAVTTAPEMWAVLVEYGVSRAIDSGSACRHRVCHGTADTPVALVDHARDERPGFDQLQRAPLADRRHTTCRHRRPDSGTCAAHRLDRARTPPLITLAAAEAAMPAVSPRDRLLKHCVGLRDEQVDPDGGSIERLRVLSAASGASSAMRKRPSPTAISATILPSG
jgi:hypothetical protein